MIPLLIATRNAHKTREFAALLGDKFSVSDLTNNLHAPEVEETGTTFEENARLKAVSASEFSRDLLVLADDSGLEVDALASAPGVRSARYAGEDATDVDNVRKLLRASDGMKNRAARFRCVIALARDGKVIHIGNGSVEGVIAEGIHGTNGFGYDPIFIPQGFDRTFAELSAAEKGAISHRAKAVASVKLFLATA